MPNGTSQEVTIQADGPVQAVGMLEAQYGRGNVWGGGVNDITPLSSGPLPVFEPTPSQSPSLGVPAHVPPTRTPSSGRDTALGLLILLLLAGVYYLMKLPWQWVAGVALVIVLGGVALVELVLRIRRKTRLHGGNIVGGAIPHDFEQWFAEVARVFDQFTKEELAKMGRGERLEWASRLIKLSLDGQRLLTTTLPNDAKSLLEEAVTRLTEIVGQLSKE